MSSRERPSFIQHSHHQTLRRGELNNLKLHQVIKILDWNIFTPNHFVLSSCTPVTIDVNWTALSLFHYVWTASHQVNSINESTWVCVMWVNSPLPHPRFFSCCFISLQVFALICDVDNPQVFTVEFIRGQIRKFSSTERYTDVMRTPFFMYKPCWFGQHLEVFLAFFLYCLPYLQDE